MQITRNYRLHTARGARPVLTVVQPNTQGGVADEVAVHNHCAQSSDAGVGLPLWSAPVFFSPWTVRQDSRWSQGRS